MGGSAVREEVRGSFDEVALGGAVRAVGEGRRRAGAEEGEARAGGS